VTIGAFWGLPRRRPEFESVVRFRAAGAQDNGTVPPQTGSEYTPRETNQLLWALKDVSFELPRGEVLGIIGRNGAGKSTLLKILSRITDPTDGDAVICGRIGSLLEVGTGFHPDLTGRENIFLNGALLGMSRFEIARRYQNIVEFSEIGRFIDTPVKRYSSGMFTRLAFSVAANLDPEILIIDEVLSVGDAAFHKKCLSKIHNLMRSGRTVILVSHNMSTIADLCQSALLLHEGRLLKSGPTLDVVTAYTEVLSRQLPRASDLPRNDTHGIRLNAVTVTNGSGRAPAVFDFAEDIIINIVYEVQEPTATLQSVITLSRNLVDIFHTFDTDGDVESLPLREPGIYRSQLRIPGHFLKGGSYSARISIGTVTDNIVDVEGAARFNVEELSENTYHRGYRHERPGHVICPGKWKVEKLS
jgi:lipopolysaccharide transport system ATP-binding protein